MGERELEKNFGTVGALRSPLLADFYREKRFQIRKSDNNSDRKSNILRNAIDSPYPFYLEFNSPYIESDNTILDFYTNLNYDLIACTVDI